MNSKGDKSGQPLDWKHPLFIAGNPILGSAVDDQSRCTHYHSELDIVSIKFKCCNSYYPCHACHEESAGHASEVWAKNERGTKAILCGSCGHEMTIDEYLASHNQCPVCKACFNPGCGNHFHLYFEP